MKKTILLRILYVFIALVLVLAIPLTMVIAGFCTPAQFNETYYGELASMFAKLRDTKGKKIVLIGNSSVAFGVRSDLLQNEFPDYTVVNFGLYGVLGTKMMLDLSKVNISDGDIIVVLPEPVEQTSSLYFSAKEAWRAIDSDFSILKYIAKENSQAMVGGFTDYVKEKLTYVRSGKKAEGSGAYSKAAFADENGKDVGYMTYNREYNIMAGGYDPTQIMKADSFFIGSEFIEYLNAYNDYAQNKGATVFYGFCPLNGLAVEEGITQSANDFYKQLSSKLEFEVIGHPLKYILDYHWFYDNNVHMNSAGMYVYTDLLAEDLKLQLGITEKNDIVIPEMPEIPVSETDSGENVDAEMFTYEIVSSVTGDFIRLTGLTAEGKNQTSLTLPTDYDGIPVREFLPDVFADNTVISKIVLTKNISGIYDDSFKGATRLSELVFRHDTVLGLNVGVDFLNGADNCLIYLKKGVSAVDCAGGWERYQSRIRYY